MTADRLARDLEADRLLQQLLEMPHGERADFLDRTCDGRPRLRAQLERLQSAASGTWDLLDHGESKRREWLAIAEQTLREDTAERWVGPYRVQREIGRGGMGVVYLGERADGHFQQLVALKLVPLGAGESRLARFVRERQILANLEHPKIARLLDGGVTAEGLPFLAMEYVDGEPIDLYCETQGIDLPGRLELFLEVCDAVSAAHRQLVVHRDIKPSNILVTTDGDVKLLDFGIARLLSDADDTISVEWSRAMTPSYASPEQFRGETVTVTSDIYQLGLLLFRLLVGRLPYDVTTGSAAQAERLVCEAPPPRASRAVANGRRRVLRGDLDNIVAKALAKSPEDRYPSVDALAADIERYRGGLPVAARRPTPLYVLGKFVSRNRWPVLATLALLAAAGTALVSHTVRVEGERDRAAAALAVAEQARDEAETVSRSLIDLFSLVDPERGPEDPVDALELLDRSVERMRSELAGQPLARARFLQTLGEIYLKLDRKERAADSLQEALELREDMLPADHPAVLESVGQLGVLLGQMRRFDDAEALLQRVVDARRRQLAETAGAAQDTAEDVEQLAIAYNNLGNLEWRRQRLDRAESLHRQALELREGQAQPDPARIGDSANNLGVLLNAQYRAAEAVPFFERALEAHSAALGADHATAAVALNNLGSALERLGRYEEAEPKFRRAFEIWRDTYGPDHVRTLRAEHNIAANLILAERYDEAIEILDRVRERLQEAGNDVDLARTLSNLGRALVEAGQLERADAVLRRALDLRRGLFGETHRSTLLVRGRIARLRYAEGRFEQAADDWRELLGLLEDEPLRAWAHDELGLTLAAAGRVDEAEGEMMRALEIRRRLLPDDHPALRRTEQRLAEVRRASSGS